jgi:hypothetical protein
MREVIPSIITGHAHVFYCPGAIALLINSSQANHPSKGLELRLAHWLGESIR